MPALASNASRATTDLDLHRHPPSFIDLLKSKTLPRTRSRIPAIVVVLGPIPSSAPWELKWSDREACTDCTYLTIPLLICTAHTRDQERSRPACHRALMGWESPRSINGIRIYCFPSSVCDLGEVEYIKAPDTSDRKTVSDRYDNLIPATFLRMPCRHQDLLQQQRPSESQSLGLPDHHVLSSSFNWFPRRVWWIMDLLL